MSNIVDRAIAQEQAKHFLQDVLRAYTVLLKIMVPAIVIVKLLELVGATEWLAYALSPLMGTMGLPSELGLVWAAAMLTNIYTAMVVFYEVTGGQVYSVAEVSVLGVLVLLSHALPIEGAVAKLLGVPWRLTIILRVFGAYILGLLTFVAYSLFDHGQEKAVLIWQPEISTPGLGGWIFEQGQLLVSILVILASLMLMMRLLRMIGFERVLGILLKPLMKLLAVKQEAANVTIIGLMLGLSFGAGLLIDESRSGRVSRRDMYVVTCFLGICHSLIEDTLLIMLLGAESYAVLWGRLFFSCLVMAILARILFPPLTASASEKQKDSTKKPDHIDDSAI